jgi:pimeloyl-ACP methyl ester carboxylesterase
MSQAPTNTSFGPLRQTEAGILNVGYAEAGPADGPTVILPHGWPYDIHSYVDVSPPLGHNMPQEAPQTFTDAIIEVDGY